METYQVHIWAEPPLRPSRGYHARGSAWMVHVQPALGSGRSSRWLQDTTATPKNRKLDVILRLPIGDWPDRLICGSDFVSFHCEVLTGPEGKKGKVFE